MQRALLVPVAALAAVVAFTSSARSQTPTPPAKPESTTRAAIAYRYRVLGVYDEQTGDPIEGVEVSDVLNGNKSLTTKTGTISLFFLPDGGSLVRLRKVGYEMQTFLVAISPTDTTPITATLTRATQLAAVVVKDSATKYISPGLRGFEDRRAKGIGQFIDEAEMRKNDEKTLVELLVARMPGMTRVAGRGGATYIASARKSCSGPALGGNCRAPNCFVSVYVDGVRTYDASMNASQIPDFGRLNPRDYAAAEFYAGGASVPVEYNATNAGCGVLLLWTRER